MVFVPVHDYNPLRRIRTPLATIGIIVLNLLAFVAETTKYGEAVAASFAIIPAELFRVGLFGGSAGGPFDALAIPERYTLFTYMFLHGDILHLLSNMLVLWVFGDNVEDALGHFRFVVFYTACGVLAALGHALMLPASALPLIGASGAVAGVTGAYLLLYPRVRVWVLAFRIIPLRLPAWLVIGSWIGVQIAMILARANTEVAWWAHISGVIAGAVLISIMRPPGVDLFQPAPLPAERRTET